MATHIKIKNGFISRLDRADHAVGDAMRAPLRDTAIRRTDNNSPFNEGFSFTQDEYDLLQKIKPWLFDQSLDNAERLKHWKTFANSTEGKAFRIC